MAELVSDELWNQIEPLLPPLPPRSPKGGRPRVEHRLALTGIVFVLKTGIPWQDLPIEMGCGSGSTCWRRFGNFRRLKLCYERCGAHFQAFYELAADPLPISVPGCVRESVRV